MSQNTPRKVNTAPETWSGSEAEHSRKIASAVNSSLGGQTNNQFTVTLAVDETTTEVLYERCRPDIAVTLTPASESSASVDVWVEPGMGKATIHHDSSSATDRKFFTVFIG